MNVPKLRFKDFTDEWKNKKIKDFLLSHKGGAPLKPTDFVKNSGYEVIPKKAISSGGKLSLDLDAATFCSESFFKNNSRSVVDDSYLITTLRDLVPSGPSIGYIVRFKSNKSYLLAQGVYGIKIDNNLEEAFLIHYSNTDKYRVMMQTMMVGSTQVHIRNSDFFKTSIKVPSLPEQTKIANFLTAIDEKITQLAQKHDLLTQYKKGLMQQIFSQKLRFKDDDGREFPEWEEKLFGEIADIQRGASPRPITDKRWFSDKSNIGWVRISDVTKSSKYLNATDQYLSSEGIEKSRYVPKGHIIMSICATIGKPIYTNLDVCIHDGFVVFKNFKANHEFFYYYLQLTEDNWYQYGQPGSQVNLNTAIVSNETIFLPCAKEQTKIANFLTAIDDKITHTQTQLDAVELYKKGLLQQMFV